MASISTISIDVEADRPGVEFRVLGPVQALRDGTPLQLGGPRQRVLLALLLLAAGRPVSTDRLIDELWSGEPPDGAEITLRSYVSRLRAALGPEVPITATADGYAIGVAPEGVDARRFEDLLRAAEAALAQRKAREAREHLIDALGLWSGRPFGELGTDGALRAEAERLNELHLDALERRIEADLDVGLAAELVDEVEALVREHPFRERLWRHLMLALYRAGRQADALGAYQRARAGLDEHLGIEPGEDLELLQGQILRHEVPPPRAAGPRHNLPAPLTSFVGREEELARVAELIAAHRLVTLTGVGGVGKTRLGLEAAHRALVDHPDGIWFVDLAPLADPGLIAGHVGSVLDLREQAGVDPIDRLMMALRADEVLLVLDNCEHLREGCGLLVARLLNGVPGLRVLATSRELLGVDGEVELAVPPLALPSARDNETAQRSEAVTLLLDRARAARPELRTDDTALSIAARIVRDLDGLPLAIELAAARARALSLQDIAERLDDRFRFLISWRRLTTARHRTLREAMDWSFELLAPEERTLLARLSVFAGGFDLDAVTTICLEGDGEAAVRQLERLVDASLVEPIEAGERLRYRILETVRQYGAEQLAASGGADATLRAHGEYFLRIAGHAQVRGPDQPAALRRIDADLDNVRAAFGHAAQLHDPDLELRLAAAMWRFWHVRGHLAEGLARLESALSRASGSDPVVRAQALHGAGKLAWAIGHYDRARAWTEELLDVAEGSGSIEDRHNAYDLLAHIALRERDFETSDRYARLTIKAAEEIGDEEVLLLARMNHAVLVLDWGRVAESIPMFDGVLAEFVRSGSPVGVGLCHLNLGEAWALQGDLARAATHFEAAWAAFESIGFRAHVGHALRGLAAVEAQQGDARRAAQLLGRAQAVMADVGASEDDFSPTLVSAAEATARAALGDSAFEDEVEAGRRQHEAG